MVGLVSELTYQNYRFNREQAPEVSPERWANVFGSQAAELEERYQAECLTEASPGDVRSFEAQELYESGVIDEARAIVEGRSSAPVTVEHLRVALSWLDGCTARVGDLSGDSSLF
jgi:hypothetical protein